MSNLCSDRKGVEAKYENLPEQKRKAMSRES